MFVMKAEFLSELKFPINEEITTGIGVGSSKANVVFIMG